MGFGGVALKSLQTTLYALEFLCAAVILGIYSYFLSVLADRDATIYTWVKAVEGVAGAAVLYTLFAVLLTCCLGGKTLFALIAIILDILFCGAFIALAVLTRDGAHSCSNRVSTPLGSGQSSSKQGFGSSGQGDQITYAVSLGTACRLNTACFAVAILGALLFVISAVVQFALRKHHQKEKKYGPSPANGYTAGTGAKPKFWQRGRKQRGVAGHRDPEMHGGQVPIVAGNGIPGHHDTVRPSHDTAFTGTTAGRTSAAYDHNKPLVGGYHTAPAGTYNHAAPTGTYNHPTPATNY
jgi:preprotein translocase subunit SecG